MDVEKVFTVVCILIIGLLCLMSIIKGITYISFGIKKRRIGKKYKGLVDIIDGLFMIIIASAVMTYFYFIFINLS